MLETLHLKSAIHDVRYAVADPVITVFGSAPRLREVSLEIDPEIFRPPVSFTLPWAQLTDLNITNILGWPEWCHIFSACVALKTGKFCVNFDQDEDNQPIIPQVTAYHDLAQLKISFEGEGEESLFDALQIPALTTFLLNGADGDSLFLLTEGSQLSSQITQGFLSQLCLGSLSVETSDLLRILGGMPALERLALDLDLDLDYLDLCESLTIG